MALFSDLPTKVWSLRTSLNTLSKVKFVYILQRAFSISKNCHIFINKKILWEVHPCVLVISGGSNITLFLLILFSSRGCLFYGPPGTGKTLVARALANECSQGDKKVAFFMRKGADCLSKWVGESERQLRLLFDQVSEIT